jgi:hypothetical protein
MLTTGTGPHAKAMQARASEPAMRGVLEDSVRIDMSSLLADRLREHITSCAKRTWPIQSSKRRRLALARTQTYLTGSPELPNETAPEYLVTLQSARF